MNKHTSPSPSGGGKTYSVGSSFSRTAPCPRPLASRPLSSLTLWFHPTMAPGESLGAPRTSFLPSTSSEHPQLPLWAATMTTSRLLALCSLRPHSLNSQFSAAHTGFGSLLPPSLPKYRTLLSLADVMHPLAFQ